MKALKFLFSVALMLIISISAFSQSFTWEISNSTMKSYYVCDTVLNTAPVTITYPYIIPAGWTWVVECVADSLTGSTAGTFTVLTTAGVTTKIFKAIGTGTSTIDGLQTVSIFSPPADIPAWAGTGLRVTASGGGTQSTRIRVWITLKKLPLS
jgi:hypothetical protein